MTAKSLSVTDRLAEKYQLDPQKFYKTLLSCLFKGKMEPTREELTAFLLVCDQYDLNPFLREIYPAISKKGALLPTLSIDGWLKLIHNQKDFDGLSVEYSDQTVKQEMIVSDGNKSTRVTIEAPMSCKVTIYQKNRAHPITIEERFKECFRPTEQWRTMPCRMLRHKTIIQCARVVYSFGGIFDNDEAERIIEMEDSNDMVDVTPVHTDQVVAPSISNTSDAAHLPQPVQEQAPQPVSAQAPASPKRNFNSDKELAKYVQALIESCVEKGVLDRAQEIFARRLNNYDYELACQQLQRYKEAQQSQGQPI